MLAPVAVDVELLLSDDVVVAWAHNHFCADAVVAVAVVFGWPLVVLGSARVENGAVVTVQCFYYC